MLYSKGSDLIFPLVTLIGLDSHGLRPRATRDTAHRRIPQYVTKYSTPKVSSQSSCFVPLKDSLMRPLVHLLTLLAGENCLEVIIMLMDWHVVLAVNLDLVRQRVLNAKTTRRTIERNFSDK